MSFALDWLPSDYRASTFYLIIPLLFVLLVAIFILAFKRFGLHALWGVLALLLFAGPGMLLVLMILFFDNWGTMEEATDIYRENRVAFHSIEEEIANYPELLRIDNDHDPDSERGVRKIVGTPPMSEESKEAYSRILGLSNDIGLRLIKISEIKNWNDRKDIKIINYSIFARGILEHAEGIEIVWSNAGNEISEFYYDDEQCLPVEEPHWYVCGPR